MAYVNSDTKRVQEGQFIMCIANMLSTYYAPNTNAFTYELASPSEWPLAVINISISRRLGQRLYLSSLAKRWKQQDSDSPMWLQSPCSEVFPEPDPDLQERDVWGLGTQKR